jgi:GNAT superfamily N-acetyltransferase
VIHTGGIELTVDDDPDAADIAFLDDRLTSFTLAASGHDDPRPLAVMARDRAGHMIGGIHGSTWGGCCELISLWVDEDQRGHGMGRALLAAAEDEARRRACTQVVLFTHDFQAPRLYFDTGYELVGTVDGYPAGGAAHWFRKPL